MIYKEVNVNEIIRAFNKDVISVQGSVQENMYVNNIPDVTSVNDTSLDWVNSSKENKQTIAENSKAKVLVVDESVKYTEPMERQGKVLLVVKKPRQMMALIATRFFVEKQVPGIHPTAYVDSKAHVDSSAHVGAGCVIGNAFVGAGTVLMPNVVLYDNVVIGDNCLIQAGTVIGTDGLGCVRDKDGRLTKFPHLGGVRIGNDVEIGANCQIAKGAFSDTIIENGCKINGLCFIAHNCHLEENVWITGDTMLSGSVNVKKNATIFSNVIIREQRIIGERSIIGMGSVVTKNVPEKETWVGNPAHKLEKK